MTEVIDHEARRQAALAKQHIEQHEDRCAERWDAARKSIDELYRRWWWLLIAMIGTEAAASFIDYLVPD